MTMMIMTLLFVNKESDYLYYYFIIIRCTEFNIP